MANLNNNQGKGPDQYKNRTKFGGYSIIGMIILLIIITLLGGCATTHEITKECCKSQKTSTK